MQSVSADQVKIGVTGAHHDNMQAVLDDLGYRYTEIYAENLPDYDEISQYDVVFVNCADGLETAAGEAAKTGSIEKFVEEGGFLYTSDFAYTFIEKCLPEYADFIGKKGEVQNVEADVVDSGLEQHLDSDSISLSFDKANWVPVDNISVEVTTYVQGEVGWSGGFGEKPIVIGFDYGEGRVLYTSFHQAAQGENAAALMEYLAEITISGGEKEDSLPLIWIGLGIVIIILAIIVFALRRRS